MNPESTFKNLRIVGCLSNHSNYKKKKSKNNVTVYKINNSWRCQQLKSFCNFWINYYYLDIFRILQQKFVLFRLPCCALFGWFVIQICARFIFSPFFWVSSFGLESADSDLLEISVPFLPQDHQPVLLDDNCEAFGGVRGLSVGQRANDVAVLWSGSWCKSSWKINH